jgi:hypothetical protein
LFEVREAAANPAPYPLFNQRAKLPPLPRLQGDPISELKRVKEAEAKSLGYKIEESETNFPQSQMVHGELDAPLPIERPSARKAEMPIEDAMKKVLQQGFPVRAASTGDSQGYKDEADKMPEDSSSGRTLERRLR